MELTYQQLQKLYSENFSLGNINGNIQDKFVLISLICNLTRIFSRKKPDVTCYQIIKKIIGEQLPEKFIQALAIICEDFSYNCNDFPNFGFEDKEMPKEIKRILMNYLPF